jgi:hypothetical protein
MSRLGRYEVELDHGVRTVLQLTPEEAAKRGAKPVEEKARPPAPNKARTSKAAGAKRSSAKK